MIGFPQCLAVSAFIAAPSKLEQAHKDFEYLKNIGMHGSAYNVLFENSTYQQIDWDRQQLVQTLRTATQNCCPRTWVEDNTK